MNHLFTHVIKHIQLTLNTRLHLQVALSFLLFIPTFVYGQNISLDDDNDNDLSSGDTHETLQGASDNGTYEHIGDITFTSGVNFSNKLQMSVTPGLGGDPDTYSNYVIIEGNLTVEGGATVTINNSSLFIVTGDVIINGDISFHNNGYVIVIGDVTGNGSVSTGPGGSALPAYVGGTIDTDNVTTSGNVDSPLNITDNTVNNILDSELPANWQNELPVELISFTASKINNTCKLEWSTASEENASHFEVYSSTDKRNWNLIGSVDANGNTSTRIDYSFTDEEEHFTSMYYKLVQFDFDGKNETFGPLVVHFSDELNTFNTSVFPNPSTNGQAKLQIGGINSTITIQLINKEGKIILSDIIDNDNITSTIYELGNKTVLQPGVYLLKVNSGTSQNIEKIMIQ
ncbi:T9SS type A sorting domain-containing protein [Flammeovirga aprica]|uniref:T9SS type A sorting domain-containing protein n=1 Tax=Flammeovirga aprica JL-4 TaxID=694437 RepID=A0A7X9XC21_9BACT|nr:T9SS type A sorting domain-containing protein [Flammeovirga aprica]NME71352.1 T9SS type A sorting domain-containing protein [Flammeovirga aprica JL-4]